MVVERLAPGGLLSGRYRVERRLGSGAGGEVWLARDELEAGRRLAVKVLASDAAAAPLSALRREFEVLAELRHPNLGQVLSFEEDATLGARFLTAPFYPGGDLAAGRGEERSLAARLVAAVEVLRALAYLHDRALVHRDVKPENVLIDAHGAARLVDFGLSRACREEAPSAPGGTPAYLAPELLEGAASSPAADLYAFGALLCGLVCGHLPFAGGAEEQLRARAERRAPDLAGAPPAASALLPLLSRLLAPRPEDRFPSAREALPLLWEALPADVDVATPESATSVLARVAFDGRHGRPHVAARTAALLRWLADGDGEPPAAVQLVVGPPGSGRSTLLAGLRHAALLAGVHVPTAVPPRAPDALAAWLGVAERGPADVDRLGQALLRVARERPVLLVLDDVDAAPPLVQRLVAYLARTRADLPRGARVLVVAAARADRATAGGALGGPGEVAEPIVLGPLDETATGAVLAAAFPGRELSARFRAEAQRATGGNPALLHELLRRHLERGALPLDDRAPVPVDLARTGVPLPASLEEAAAERLAGLAAAARAVLEDLALLSPPVPRATFAAAAARPGLDGTLAALVSAGLLAVRHTPDGEALDWGDTAVAALVARELEAHPLRARAAALSSALRTTDVPPARLAQLLYAADERVAAAAHAVAAGRALLAQGGPADARAWLERALADLDPAGAPACEARLLLAEACAALGDPRAAAAALAVPAASDDARVRMALARAGHLVTAGDHGAALAALATIADAPAATLPRLVLAARAQLLLGAHAAAAEAAQSALAHAGDATGPATAAAVVRATTSLALSTFYRGDYAQAAVLLRSARARIESGAAPEERAFVLNCEGLVRQRQGDLEGAAARYRESADVARLRGDLARAGAATVNLGTVAQEAGDLATAIEAFEEAARTARRLEDRPLLAKARMNLANLHTLVGALEAAARHVTDGLALCEAEGLALFAAYLVLIRAEGALHRGAFEAARRDAAEACARFRAAGAQRECLESALVTGRVALAAGDAAAVRAAAEELLRQGPDLPRFVAWGHYLRAEAEWARFGGDPARALADYRAAAAAGRDGRAEDRWRIHLGMARALAGLGRRDEAAEEGRRALGLLDGVATRLTGDLRTAWEALPERRAAYAALAGLVPAAGGPAASAASAGQDEAFLSQVLDLNKRLASETDLERLLATILDVAIALTGAERGFVLLPSESQPDGKLRIRVARNFDREAIPRRQMRVSTSIASEVFVTGRPLASVDAMEDERLKAHMSIAALHLRSVLCVPLRHRGDVRGVVYIDNRFQRGAFSGGQRARLEAFADQAAIALAGAQALEQERRARAELESARRRVEQLNRELADDLTRRTADLAAAEARLRAQEECLEARYDYRNIVGTSPAIRRVFAVLDRVTDTAVPVLVTGESGTGKELVARAVHFNGPRRTHELVSLNCAALPESLLESELFGSARGAFTGADRDRAGFLERADRGTLLLDEVGDMPLTMQAKLLRVLETGEFTRLGETRARRVDVRIVAATNRDLRARVREGAFREDLFYRLDVVPIVLPPLRERAGDLPLLATHFLARHAERAGIPPKRLSPGVLAVLERYRWPGNVRELQATITTLALLADGDVITEADLAARPELTGPEREREAGVRWDGRSTLAEIERAIAADAVLRCGGNRLRAAKALGVSRNTLYARLGGD